MFHPIAPSVRWSSVENSRAVRYGTWFVVDSVAREAQVGGRRGQRAHQEGRVVARRLGGVAHGVVARAPPHVVEALHVGEEEQVEAAALERAGHVGPVAQRAVAGRRCRRRGASTSPRPSGWGSTG